MKKTTITNTISAGINFLEKSQEEDGSFYNLSSPKQNSYVKAKQNYKTPFFTALILSCLNSVNESLSNPTKDLPSLPWKKLNTIREKAYKFLLSEKSKHWSYNYWSKNGGGRKIFPYPDDLDDTFCALYAMAGYNSSLIDGEAWAKIVPLLTATEKKEGGPYKTWLVDNKAPKDWQDIDLGVNANIAYFLFTQNIELEGIKKFINKAVEKLDFTSRYYIPTYPVAYFISRFYKEGFRQNFAQYIYDAKRTKSHWGDPLKTALAISTLLNLGYPASDIEKEMGCLIRQQEDNGFRPYTIGWDPGPNHKILYAGSPSITTAFTIEALSKYLSTVEDKGAAHTSALDKKKSEENLYIEVVLKQISPRLESLPFKLKELAEKELDSILTLDKGSNSHQIILLPYLFFKSLKPTYTEKIKKNFLIELSKANLYGWIAYTIYDDFYDNEANIKLLPLANIFLRETTRIFESVMVASGTTSESTQPREREFFSTYFHEVMDELDFENFHEVTFDRLKKEGNIVFLPAKLPSFGRHYEHLYRKSLGHALGPLAILVKMGFNKDSSEFQKTLGFFKSYIVVRQLNDDAHDWEKDLSNGFITLAVKELIKDLREKYPSKKQLNLKKDLDDLKVIFWQKTIVRLCDKILEESQNAKITLDENKIFGNNIIFKNLIIKIEEAAHTALKEREEALKFLGAYTDSL